MESHLITLSKSNFFFSRCNVDYVTFYYVKYTRKLQQYKRCSAQTVSQFHRVVVLFSIMEIYDWDTLTPFELNRQKNIIRNYEFMKACGEFVINIF